MVRGAVLFVLLYIARRTNPSTAQMSKLVMAGLMIEMVRLLLSSQCVSFKYNIAEICWDSWQGLWGYQPSLLNTAYYQTYFMSMSIPTLYRIRTLYRSVIYTAPCIQAVGLVLNGESRP